MTLDVTRALCTLEQARARLGISTSAHNDTLEQVITEASSLIEEHCGRVFGYEAGIVEYATGHGTSEITVSRAPIASIASIVDDGSTLDATTYHSRGEQAKAGVITCENGVMWRPLLRGSGASVLPVTGHDLAAVVVTYAGGYILPGQTAVEGVEALPGAVRTAALTLVAHLYARRATDPSVASESLLGYSVSYRQDDLGDSGLPRAVERMLAPFRFASMAG